MKKVKKYAAGDMVYAGGNPNFDETTGRYVNFGKGTNPGFDRYLRQNERLGQRMDDWRQRQYGSQIAQMEDYSKQLKGMQQGTPEFQQLQEQAKQFQSTFAPQMEQAIQNRFGNQINRMQQMQQKFASPGGQQQQQTTGSMPNTIQTTGGINQLQSALLSQLQSQAHSTTNNAGLGTASGSTTNNAGLGTASGFKKGGTVKAKPKTKPQVKVQAKTKPKVKTTVKKMSTGGNTLSASRRGDGIAIRGKTRGKIT